MTLNSALKKCLMLARIEKNRRDTNSRTLAAWAHVIRFCDEAGITESGLLRDSFKIELTTQLCNELLPEPSHEGSCTPESGCDGICVERASIVETVRTAIDKAFEVYK